MNNAIKVLRTRKKWSMQRLADAVGTTKSQIYKLEAGDRRLTAEWMTKIASALGCEMSELLVSAAEDSKGLVVVDVVEEVDSAIGGWVQPLEQDASYQLRMKMTSNSLSSPLYAVQMKGSHHREFSDGTELVFAGVTQETVLENGKYVLVEEKVDGRTLRYMGRLEVGPSIVCIRFDADHPRHHQTIVYQQLQQQRAWLEDGGRDALSAELPQVSAESEGRRIVGVLVKSIRNE